MANFNFNLREPNGTEETPINLVIRYNNKRFVYPTNLTIPPKYWEKDKEKKNYQRAKATFPNAKNFNSSLENLKTGADNVFLRYQNENKKDPSFDELRNLLDIENNREENLKLNLYQFFEKFIEESKFKTNIQTKRLFSVGTIKIYKNSLSNLIEFAKVKNKKIDFDSINLDFYYQYIEHLTNKKKYSTNTIGRQIKTLKTVLNDATERGINTNLSFKSKNFRKLSEKVGSVYLTDIELNELYHLDLSGSPKLDRVRDLFLIGCYTGLRFSDFSKIKAENIQGEFIKIITQKTFEPIVIPVNNIIEAILKKYNNNLPKISNQKMNEYLKEVAKKIESLHVVSTITNTTGGASKTSNFKKYTLISSHTARRSFATNAYLSKVPPSVIMGITGHKSEASFFNYIKITPDEKAKILQMYMKDKQFNLKAV